jgi:hypothetical protein
MIKLIFNRVKILVTEYENTARFNFK